MIIQFLEAFGRDFAYNFLVWDLNNFFTSTLLLVVGIVLVAVIKNFVLVR